MSVPTRLVDSLRCLECRATSLQATGDTIRCPDCEAAYHVENGIPSMLSGSPADQDWNEWDKDEVKKVGHSYYRRATGDLPEKEASKSLSRLLEDRGLYTGTESILDLGCASGHFLRSFRRLLDEEVAYTGIDVHMQYLQWGREAFGVSEAQNFLQCDALDMPLADNAFDIVFVNLFHFFPRVDEALAEALRVAADLVIWRTPVGEVTYRVEVISDDEFADIGVIEPGRDDFESTLYMLYSERYIRGLVDEFGWDIRFFERDTDFEAFDNNELDEFEDVPATKVVNDMQINGNLLLDWHYVAIDPGD